MSDEVRSISEAAERIDIFGNANTSLYSSLPVAVELFGEVGTIREGLEQAGALRSSFGSSGKSNTQSKAAVYNSIYRRLRRISRTAAIIKQREPDFENKYQLPHDKMSYQEGFERAKAIYNDSAADREKFFAYGLKSTFRDDLNADITAFEGAGEGQSGAKLSGVGETANINALIERFMKIHPVLNQLMKNLLADDPENLAEWKSAAHIERKKGGSPKPSGENPPPAPPTG